RFWWHARMMRYPRFVYNNFLRCTLRLNSHNISMIEQVCVEFVSLIGSALPPNLKAYP
ncbi:hypothetical protein ACFDR9_002964, partial [Janthinobacterium sp. CG_23.3]